MIPDAPEPPRPLFLADKPQPRRPVPIYAADQAPRFDWAELACNLMVALFALWVLQRIFFPDLGAHQ